MSAQDISWEKERFQLDICLHSQRLEEKRQEKAREHWEDREAKERRSEDRMQKRAETSGPPGIAEKKAFAAELLANGTPAGDSAVLI
ncbi:hypothetical protein PsorP6_010824 [Peronosclerospora sorghi]|uniref:Uncharacterized protein n=1 Tax=Peronosclerospora sorghi TaxID=230839 RepID=A0ACC0VXE4_9STRA|nr:hypothetical protein PsorP6_010824 [Peronosclerospora sorghi]